MYHSLRYLVSGFALIVVLFFSYCSTAPSTYSALSATTKYVGNASCQTCHTQIAEDYAHTGMGKSLYPPNPTQKIEDFTPESVVYDAVSDFYYHPFWMQDSLFVLEFRLEGKDTLYKRVEKIDYIVGSGNQTRSYILNRKGYLYEVPITWYVSKGIWALSPGYENGNNSRFSREIGQECLACHTGNFEFEAGSKNRFTKIEMGIDCERCHGPGSIHVERMQAEKEVDVGKEIDYSIVNPQKLSIELQFDVCQQCHLQGINVMRKDKNVRDFRPAMPLEEQYAVFIQKKKNENEFGIASHAERLKQSQCFIQSKGKLVCSTCHNPHKSIHKTDKESYNLQCKTCHTPAAHSDPHAPAQPVTCTEKEAATLAVQNNCVSCHLPTGGTSDIPHVRFHDHNIRIVKPENLAPATIPQTQEAIELLCAMRTCTDNQIGTAYLQLFEQHQPNPAYLRSALQKLSPSSHYEKARVAYYQGNTTKALSEVETALQSESQNPYLHFLAGEIYEAQKKYTPAYTYYQQSYSLNPASTDAGLKMVATLLLAKQGDKNALADAERHLTQLLKQKPFDEKILSNMGFVYMNQQKYTDAERYFLRALSYNPDYTQAIQNLITLYTVKGELKKADEYALRLKKDKTRQAK